MRQLFKNMKKVILGLLLLGTLHVNAQQQKDLNAGDATKTPVEVKFLGFANPVSDDIELVPNYMPLISKNESENQEALEKIKEQKMEQKKKFLDEIGWEIPAEKKTRANFEPNLEIGYNALNTSGTPSDNTIAVNNNNQIVAVVNSSLRYYSATTGAGLQGVFSLASFFASPQNGTLLTNNLCDPKVIFDPQVEKFIMFAQTCDGSSSSSQLLLAFSKTSDPTQGWYFYQFSGNQSSAVGTNGWFDYPKIGVSGHDVFVTGNIFDDNYNYVQSVIFQIDKTKCFAGSTLNLAASDAIIYANISNSPFTMVPMSNGQSGTYGNKMYLVSTSQSWTGQSSLLTYTIDNIVQNNPNISVQSISIPSAGAPANAVQKGTTMELNTGDNRGMDGFYLNGRIHFVFHSDVGNGYAGINYSRLKLDGSSWNLENNQTIKATGKDFTFPSIASMGWNGNDQSAIIHFNYASNNDYPGMKAVFVNENAVASAPIEIKTGTGYVNINTGGSDTRWGDYSGIGRVLNATKPTAWCFGMFGNTSHGWTNHFAKITTTAWPVGVTETVASEPEVVIYPNPVVEDIFYMNLNLPKAGSLQVNLLDMNGNLIKKVYQSNASAGKGVFSFNQGAIANGTYLVQVLLNNTEIQHEKITINK